MKHKYKDTDEDSNPRNPPFRVSAPSYDSHTEFDLKKH